MGCDVAVGEGGVKAAWEKAVHFAEAKLNSEMTKRFAKLNATGTPY